MANQISKDMEGLKTTRMTHEQFEEALRRAEEALRRAEDAIADMQKQSISEKRTAVHKFAEAIIKNDVCNNMPAHEIASKAVEVYNKIEDYL